MPSRQVYPTLPRDIAPGDVVLYHGPYTVREVVKQPVAWRHGRMVSPVKYRIFLEGRPGYVVLAPNHRLGRVVHYCQKCGESVTEQDGAWEADGLIGRENYESKDARLHCDRSEDHRHA